MRVVSFFARALAVTATLTLVAGACSGGGSSSGSGTGPEPTGSVTVTAGPVTVATAGIPGALPVPTRDQIIGIVKQYLENATVTPVRTGRAAGDLAPLFTAPAIARVNGTDHAVLVDDGIPRAITNVMATAEPVTITALADPTGAVVLADASLVVTVATKTAGGPVRIKRTGDLLFAPDGGIWKIAGFDLSVNRSGAGLGGKAGTSSTTRSG